MKKYIILTMLLCLVAIIGQAQIKDLEISKRDLSNYTPTVQQGILSGNTANYTNRQPVQYKAMTPMHKNQFSGMLSAEFLGDRPVLISGIIKGSDTRDMPSATFNYLLEAKKIMSIVDPINEFVATSTIVDEQGNRHLKMQQVYQGIPIFGREVILHENRDQIESLNGRFVATPTNLVTKPTISIEENRVYIQNDIGSPIQVIDKAIPGHELMEQWKQELVILPSNDDSHLRLAYHNTVYVNILDRVEYFVDAHTGEIIESYGSICKLHGHSNNPNTHGITTTNTNHDNCTSTNNNSYDPLDGPVTADASDLFNNTVTINTYQSGNNFYMIDASRNMFNNGSDMPDEPRGAIWTIDAFNTSPQKSSTFNYDHVKSGNNTWSSDKTAVSAHYNGGKAFLYYKNVHGRNSIDGNGGNIVSLVNISDENGSSLGNAFWNGQAMFYGNGDSNFKPLARALDVAGHELTHGVVQNTANLVYQGEAGAINESMADIFGAMIDRDDWRIGEDVVKPGAFPSGALRSLQDPHNGQATNDFGKGWQPKHVNEQYTGSQDNGGVHLNSGISNYAFYIFANDPKLGGSENARKQKAEKVYYKALSQYMTKSSQFVDLRIAVVKAAGDLYSQDVVDAAKNAFEAVGVGAGTGGNYETDYEANPGQEWLIVADVAKTKLILLDKDRTVWANPLSNTAPLSKPSVSDSGKDIVFVGKDKKIHVIKIDWGNTGNISEFLLESGGSTDVWRNAIVSKDGTKLAALKDEISNEIHIYDDISGNWKVQTLYNPTYSEGVNTGEVLFADAMEFDPTGEWVMYDAKSEITSTNGSSISYWDIGFLKVWDNSNDQWGDGKVEKLFSALPDDLSIGNPTYSKNSSFIIAFDYILGEQNVNIVGANIETNKTDVITTDLFSLAYPNYSADDKQMVYDFEFLSTDLGILDLKDNKIDNISDTEFIYLEEARWGVFFSDGVRDLSTNKELATEDELLLNISPNPIKNVMNLTLDSKWRGDANISILDVNGKLIQSSNKNITKGTNSVRIDTDKVPTGMYILQLTMEEGSTSQKIMKVD